MNSKTYSDFGEASTSGGDRLGYIGKENDVESGLGDFGVRKYDDAAGRFLSIDPLWEKYLAWSPYHYCGNNPINATDENGMNGVKIVDDKNKSITVTAVYIVDTEVYNSDNIEELNKISTFLNNQKYSVSEGEYSGFAVKFDLKFIADYSESERTMNNAEDYNYDGTSIGNSFSKKGSNYSENGRSFAENSQGRGRTIAGITKNHRDIIMNSVFGLDDQLNRVHEIFHTLFFDYDRSEKGIGAYHGHFYPDPDDINLLISNPLLKAKK